MRIVKTYPEADGIISALLKYHNEDGKDAQLEITKDESKLEDSIILRQENKYPEGYGLMAISSKIDAKLSARKEIVFLGISSYSSKELEELEKNKARYFTMKKITQMGMEETVDLAMENAVKSGRLCISINTDVLDRAFCTDGIVGGMTTRELISIIQRLKLMKNLKTVEICSGDKEIAAKLIKELIL
jgi:arginase family enzyme